MNSGPPIGFGCQQIMDYYNMQPSEVRGRCNAGTELHRRFLYNKLFSVYEFDLPKEWALNWFRFWLFYYGSLACLYTKEYGWVIQPYGFTKLDLYYNPSEIQVWNQHFKQVKTGVIGVNAEIIRIMDDYFGLDALVTYYAEMLAQIDRSFNVSLMNSNVTLLAQVENKKKADELKEAYGKATTGSPLVTVNKDLIGDKPLDYMLPKPKDNLMAKELLEARRNVINMFLTDVGIPNFNMDKRAQQSPTEIKENDGETDAICSVIFDNLKECFEKIRNMGGPDCSVKLRFKGGEYRGENDIVGHVAIPTGNSKRY